MEHPRELEQIEQILNRKHALVVIKFSATWCGPCRIFAPIFETIASRLSSDAIVFVSVDEGEIKDACFKYGVQAFPTTQFYFNGDKVSEFRGSKGATEFEAEVKKWHNIALSIGSSTPTIAGHKLGGSMNVKPQIPSKIEEKIEPVAPVAKPFKIDEALVSQIVGMGFTENAAQRAAFATKNADVDDTVTWICEHIEDEDINEPFEIPVQKMPETEENMDVDLTKTETAEQEAKSIKCMECGKLFKSADLAAFHGDKSGHSKFEESTDEIVPLTEDQKKQKIVELRSKIAAKRKAREQEEAEQKKISEIERRAAAKYARDDKDERMKRHRELEAKKRKKAEEFDRKERLRLKAELRADKLERMERAGIKITAEDVMGAVGNKPSVSKITSAPKPKASPIERVLKSCEVLKKHRLSNGGLTCLKILEKVVLNAKDPSKRKLSQTGKAYQNKIAPFIGGKTLLNACGFESIDEVMILKDENVDLGLLSEAHVAIQSAISSW